MSTLLIKNARYIVSCDDTDRLYERSNLFIRDNAIEYIGPELRQADQVIDASRMVVYPGLINTHHHLYLPDRPERLHHHCRRIISEVPRTTSGALSFPAGLWYY